MSEKLKKKIYRYYLNSENRTNGTIPNATYNINPISLSHPNTKFSVKILSVDIPFCWKQLETTTINWSMTRGGSYSGSFTISGGNYTSITLLNQIKSELRSSILSVSGIDLTTLSFTYDEENVYATFGFLSELTPTSITLSYNANVMIMLGFLSDITFDETTSQTSSQPVNFSPSNSLFIRSSFQSDTYEALYNSIHSSSILSKIPIRTLPGWFIRYQNVNDEHTIINDIVINSISLILTDNRSVEPLNISLNYNIAIEIEELVVEQPTDVKQNTDNVPQKKRNLTIDELTKYRNELLK